MFELTDTEEEAAEAYENAAIKFRAENAITNFESSRYDVKAIMDSTVSVGRETNGRKERKKEMAPEIIFHPIYLVCNRLLHPLMWKAQFLMAAGKHHLLRIQKVNLVQEQRVKLMFNV